jgi:mannose-6-phosphate isomerase-like protein (cupin superfamily)
LIIESPTKILIPSSWVSPQMTDKKYPYVNHMNILYDVLQLVDVPALVEKCTDEWYNQTLCQVNESVVRLGILKGEYHWHKHDVEDEFFFTLNGELFIDIENSESITLKQHQGYVVPKGVAHKTRAPEKTVVLMIETAGIIPTGDA